MKSDNRTWPDLAIGLYDRLTSRGAEITYEMDDLTLTIPASADAQPSDKKATWTFNGALRIRTRDVANA